MEIVSLLVAQAPAGNSAQPLIMMVLMFVIMYFLLIRPQKLKQKELEARITQIKTGDKILTTAGIHGFVTNVKERTIMVKVDNKNNVKMEFEKASIATIFPKADGAEDSIEVEEVSE
ncbi:MAG: preprotein translocase subunit YajC [Verrucomicrobiales bacterium]|jgi:preprotein translocase subunit YajC